MSEDSLMLARSFEFNGTQLCGSNGFCSVREFSHRSTMTTIHSFWRRKSMTESKKRSISRTENFGISPSLWSRLPIFSIQGAKKLEISGLLTFSSVIMDKRKLQITLLGPKKWTITKRPFSRSKWHISVVLFLQSSWRSNWFEFWPDGA